MDIQVTEVVSGRLTELHLRYFDPGDSSVGTYYQEEPGSGLSPAAWGGIIAVGLGLLVLFAGDR
jgi:hypothetical protein